MNILQNFFILILNPIYTITKKIPEKIKETLITVCFIYLFLMQIFINSNFFIWDGISFTSQAFLGCIFLFFIIIMSINKKLELLNNFRVLPTLWMTFGVIIIIVSFIHPVGEGFRALALTVLIAFPCLYFVWGNRGDYNKLFELITKAIAFVGGMYFIFCILTVPFETAVTHAGRYAGTANNPNFLGMICSIVLCASLYLIINETKYIWLYYAVCGLSLMFSVLSVSRTSILSILITTIFFIIFYFKVNIVNNKKKLILNMITIILIFISFSILGLSINKSISNLSTEYTTNKTNDSTKKLIKNKNVTKTNAFDRLKIEDKDLNTISSGRLTIWKYYLKHINLIGNKVIKTVYVKDLNLKVYGAHNTPLDIAYRTGVINGVVWLIIEIFTGLKALIFVFGKKYKEPYYLFMSMSIIIFCVYSMLEIAIFPFKSQPVLLFYLAISPLFFKKDI
ncbi:hypothetical protein ANASTE_01590 [Anaerofustis stercorihominis DSM 17244]|uniref:O-antigen ligase-related domain-containing protein n=2 Tax=Anaerofustis stercorihominis TaxID=214853 RepID=B1CC89_9FIRM|nr:O-antigen ligase family protein [Anaerofustis stercorihominis]EDS71886.1 hypothetical protein ANASTE_01590 [Anaerofustis stercorihominis DSM 17244]